MYFDWELLKPDRELSKAQRLLVREIGETFLTTGKGTPDHQKRVELGKNRGMLNDLTQLSLIKNDWNQYYPTFLGLYYVSDSLRTSYTGIVHLLFSASKSLYESLGPRQFSISQIEARVNALLTGSKPEELVQLIKVDAWLNRASLFLSDFTQFFIVKDLNPNELVCSVIATEKILDYEGLQGACDQQLSQWLPKRTESENLQLTSNPEMTLAGKSRNVFVIHGRDERLRAGVFDFLRALHLQPIEWTKALSLTGKASPYIGEILAAAFSHAQAVVVLLSPDDEAKLRADLLRAGDPPSENELTGQARPNVLFEAGMAFSSHQDRTVLMQFGEVRPFSDVAGRHVVKMDNSFAKRQELALKLKTAGCSVDMEGTDWHASGDLKPPVQNKDKVLSAPNNSTVQVGDTIAKIETAELWMSLQQGCHPDFILLVENKSDDEITIESIALKRGKLYLCEPSKPKKSEELFIAAHSKRQISSWPPPVNPTYALQMKEPHLKDGQPIEIDIVVRGKILGIARTFSQTILATVDYQNRRITQFGG